MRYKSVDHISGHFFTDNTRWSKWIAASREFRGTTKLLHSKQQRQKLDIRVDAIFYTMENKTLRDD